MVFPILIFATMLQEAGLGAALIQRRSVSDGELATLFWLNGAIGLLLCLVLMTASPFIAGFYGDGRLVALTCASAGLVLLSALGAQPISLLNRDMQYGRLALIDTLAQAVGFIAALAAAWAWHSYWAIWLMYAATTGTSVVMGWLLGGRLPRGLAPVTQVADMLRFGWNLTLFNIFNYFGRNLDKVLIGRVWGGPILGLYDRAYKLLMLPLLVVSSPLQRLVVPILARTREEPAQHRRVYLSTLQIALLLTAPLVAQLLAAPVNAMHVLLGPQWGGAAPIFAWLGIASMLQLLTNSFGWLYISQGRARHMMQAGAASSLWGSIAFFIGLPWGAVGVATAYALSEMVRTPVLIWWVTREGPVRWGDIVGAMLPFVPAIGLAIVAVRFADANAALSPLPKFLLSGALAYACAFVALFATRAGRDCALRILRFGRMGAAMATGRLRPARA